MEFKEYFNQFYLHRISENVSVKYKEDNTNSNHLGPLNGFDLVSDSYLAYLYYWGFGYLDFMVYDLKKDKEEIPITMVKVIDFRQDEIINSVVKYFIN